MTRQLGIWHAFRSARSSSGLVARLRGKFGLVIISAWPTLLALLVMRHFQVLEEDVDPTFWASAPGYVLVYCQQCQRQQIIPEQDDSQPAPMCSGGRLLHRHPKTTMLRSSSGRSSTR